MTTEITERDIRASLRASGCVCNADIAIVREAEGIYRSTVGHDDWCPLLRARNEGAGNAGPQLVVLLRAIKAQSAPMTEHQAEARALLVRALEAKYGKSENER